MRTNLISIVIGCLSISGLTVNLAQADDYYSNIPAPNSSASGYYSTGSDSRSGYYSAGSTPVYPQERHHRERHGDRHEKFSISVNLPSQNVIYPPEPSPPYLLAEGPYYRELQWVDMVQGSPIPSDAVIGGYQMRPRATLYICRSFYRGGMHPGKLFNGNCNIGWGGDEVVTSEYQVLVSRANLTWVSASFGRIPTNAIPGGYQQDGPLYICQANYRGGMHPGKIIKQMCNIGWGGSEISIPYYNVLVR